MNQSSFVELGVCVAVNWDLTRVITLLELHGATAADNKHKPKIALLLGAATEEPLCHRGRPPSNESLSSDAFIHKPLLLPPPPHPLPPPDDSRLPNSFLHRANPPRLGLQTRRLWATESESHRQQLSHPGGAGCIIMDSTIAPHCPPIKTSSSDPQVLRFESAGLKSVCCLVDVSSLRLNWCQDVDPQRRDTHEKELPPHGLL
ncbi:unnamed protein product [Pleuronectes platessa]|uniref:Uncharacterized protein n=1 Tax=Pleuronectes platessa TaxID=8262 RepID=A0A9N7VVH2_PLEPL|nr:unnamed protein product [Pleuronectes platessa]